MNDGPMGRGWGNDRCAVCKCATTHAAGQPPICGLQDCKDKWARRIRPMRIVPPKKESASE